MRQLIDRLDEQIHTRDIVCLREGGSMCSDKKSG